MTGVLIFALYATDLGSIWAPLMVLWNTEPGGSSEYCQESPHTHAKKKKSLFVINHKLVTVSVFWRGLSGAVSVPRDLWKSLNFPRSSVCLWNLHCTPIRRQPDVCSKQRGSPNFLFPFSLRPLICKSPPGSQSTIPYLVELVLD